MSPTRRSLLRSVAVLVATGGGTTMPAQAADPPPEVRSELGASTLLGGGRLRFLGMRIYDARLWARERVQPTAWSGAPLALELQYARSLVGRLIAERSLQEMQRQRPIDATQAERWQAALAAILPDVREGDRITGVHRPGESARFFFNGTSVGEVRDAEFARLFFGIWLAPQTSEPALREALFGLGKSTG